MSTNDYTKIWQHVTSWANRKHLCNQSGEKVKKQVQTLVHKWLATLEVVKLCFLLSTHTLEMKSN